MKKATLKQLRDIAAKLEPIYEKKTITITGQQLIDTGTTTANNQPIQPDQHYKVTLDAPANHYRKLKEAFKFGGITACNQYIQSVNEVAIKATTSTIEQYQSLNDRKELFSI